MTKEQKFKVLITNPIVCHEAVEMLHNFAEVQIIKGLSPEEIVIEAARDVDAILARTVKITKNVIVEAKNLKIISRHGVGVDGIDVKEATRRGIFVTNTPEANAEAVSEFTLTLMLVFYKKILDGFNMVRHGDWERDKLIQRELFHKKLGIIGLGNIGSRIAKKAQAFEMETLGFDPYIPSKRGKEINVKLVEFDELLKQSDIVSLNLPLTPETKNLIGLKELILMKKTALLVNTSRGGIVNEEDLVKALKSKEIAGACLDTFCEEPLSKTSELLLLENVIFTPHVAAQTEEALVRVGVEAADNIIRVLKGKIPNGIYNKKVLENNKLRRLYQDQS